MSSIHDWKNITPPEKKKKKPKPKLKKTWNKLYERVEYTPDTYCPKRFWAEVNGEGKRRA